jgi:hypothetical protein
MPGAIGWGGDGSNHDGLIAMTAAMTAAMTEAHRDGWSNGCGLGWLVMGLIYCWAGLLDGYC